MNMTPKEYNRYVARLAKKSPLGKDLLNSFLIGGLICVVGQLILNGYTALELSEQDAAAAGAILCFQIIEFAQRLNGFF